MVIALDVTVGDRVEAGQRLGLLETMKVEVAFHAPFAGTVAAVPVRRNERVAAGAVLVQIQTAGARRRNGWRVAARRLARLGGSARAALRPTRAAPT